MTDLFKMLIGPKIDEALLLLKEHEPPGGYYGCFSGGKDSVVIEHLAKQAGVLVDWHYNVTTADPPELTRFIKKTYPHVHWERQKNTIFTEVLRRGIPTRRIRWCCSVFKERGGSGRVKLLGIRAEESPRRARNWAPVSFGQTGRGRKTVLPIFNWTSSDVWSYINREGIPVCSLYGEGFKRLGCVLCPMAGKKGKRRELERWPKIAALWKRAFERLWEARPQDWSMKKRFSNYEELWQWWVSDTSLPPIPCGGDGHYPIEEEEE
jgi:phosphoadenosine phosphosulfate reductase